MGVEYDYSSTRLFTFDEVVQLHEMVRESYPEGFMGFSNEQTNDAFFSPVTLPALGELQEITLKEIATQGYLPLKKEPWDAFKGILEKGATIGDIGLLIVRCGYEEKASKQTKRAFDFIGTRVEKTKKFFSFYAKGSKVSFDYDYRKDFMVRLIKTLQLPLNLAEENGHFTLSHTASGYLKITVGLFGKDPSAFYCEIPEATIDDLLDKMKLFLAEFATQKRFEYSWKAACSGYPDPEVSKQIYEMVLSANFPAEHYFLDIQFSIDTIAGIETVRKLCGPKDEVFTGLCSFKLPDDTYGTIVIVTTSDGHRIDLTIKDFQYLEDIKKKLHIDFKESP